MIYRRDIDGLRGLAILVVVLYHFFPSLFPAGFVGVDVFFVISGYLITSIVNSDIKDKRFSFLNFYYRRINRLFPALILVLTLCSAMGWWVLYDKEFSLLGQHLAASAAFIANIIFSRESSGYFDILAEKKPLLHLWSLAVEEQFYLFWPLILLLTKRSRSLQAGTLMLIILISFSYSLTLLFENLNFAFFLTGSRVWQLSIGGLAAIYLSQPRTAKNSHLVCASAATIFFAILSLFIKKENGYPGIQGIAPTLAAFFFILRGALGPEGIVQKLLSHRVVVFTGLISYPLYLFHWPLLSYYTILFSHKPDALWSFVLLGTSFFLATAVFIFVEKPLRNLGSRKAKAAIYLSGLLLLGLFGLSIEKNNGYHEYRSIAVAHPNRNKFVISSYSEGGCTTADVSNPQIIPICKKFLAPDARSTIVLWGDSSSLAWSPVFLDIAYGLKINVYLFMHPGCPPILGVRKTFFENETVKSYCADFKTTEAVLDSFKKLNPDHIFVLGAWNFYSPLIPKTTDVEVFPQQVLTSETSGEADPSTNLYALQKQVPKTLETLSKICPTTVFRSWPIIPYYPRFENDRLELLFGIKIEPIQKPTATHEAESQLFNDIFDSIEIKNVDFFDPAPVVCGPSVCLSQAQGIDVYKDRYHVTPQGSMLIRADMLKILNALSLKK